MSDYDATLKAIADTAADLLAKEIADVRREAARHEEIRALEYRAFMAETRETVAGLMRQVEEKLATVRDGRDGVDGQDGKDGRDGADGKDGIDGQNGDHGADGRDGADADMDALKQHLAELVAAIPVPQDGKDGRDGVDGKDAYPGEVKGVFDPEGEYRARDVVAYDGSSWMAKRDEPGDLPGDGWMLLASRGKRGDRGEQGREGKQGEPGAAIIAAYADTEKLELILTRDDGQEVKADLYELAQTIRK